VIVLTLLGRGCSLLILGKIIAKIANLGSKKHVKVQMFGKNA
jgi:hypothetical protein